jgi:hypothetical protein
MTAAVNDSTYVYGRFLSQMDFVNETDATTSMDRLFVHHQFGNAAGVTIGRSELYMGTTGMFYDDIFDGVRANVGTKKLNLEAGYGRFKTWNSNVNTYSDAYSNGDATTNHPEAVYASLKGQIGAATLGADYVHSAKYSISTLPDSISAINIWGANLNVPVGDFAVFGDYYKNTKKTPAYDKPAFYTAGLAYGSTVASKPGTFRIGAQYVKAETGSYFGGTTMQVDPMALTYSYNSSAAGSTGNADLAGVLKNVKYWLATADVMLMKNVRLHGEYAFNVKGDKAAGGSTDFDDIATVSLNYNF